ncbi:hypothetical protein [Microbacterium sp. E-13]|uniref:hypothetical protein n=1 Tax=Microbacterium sp. E-13 TaxID=3404048 RepID=UPI003CF46752
MASKTVTPEELLDAAKAAAASARDYANTIEAELASGRGKHTIADLEDAERAARVADLAAQAAQSQIVESVEKDRLARIRAIRDEIEASSLRTADHYADLLANLESALLAFREAAEERATTIREWRRALLGLNVETITSNERAVVPEGQAGIAPLVLDGGHLGGGKIRVDQSTIGSFDADFYVGKMAALPLQALRRPELRNEDLERILRSQVGNLPA